MIFDFFTGELTPEEAMPKIIDFAGKQYDFISYLYFLKDWERFMHVRPTTFQTAFELLEVTWCGEIPKLSGRCSWENYQMFNETLVEVQTLLLATGVPHVRLLDAHSFCWTIGRAELPEIEELAPTLIQEVHSEAGTIPVAVEERNEARSLIDFEALAKRRAFIGRLAEERARDAERARLREAGRQDLAERVRLVSDDHTLGYDLESFELDQTPRRIEVKAVGFEEDQAEFYLTENEWQTSRRVSNYWLYLVSGAQTKDCAIRAIRSQDILPEQLTPVVYQARVPLRH